MNWKRSLVLVIAIFASLYLAGCGGSSTPPSVSVNASTTTVDATDTVNLTASVTNDKNAAGVSWTVTGGGALSGQTTSAATYTAPAPSSSALSVTVTATSVADSSKSASATITVPAAPAITTAALATAAVGATYAEPLVATGGVPPYKWTLTSGTLPSCLTITQSASGASVGGTLSAACVGTFNDLVFTVTDSGTPNALTTSTAAMGLEIDAAPAITFSGLVPATATAHVAYAGGSAAASGGAGALTYTVFSGALPTGLGLNAATGAITGTPTTANTFGFVIKAADAFGDSNTQAYQIVVSPPAAIVFNGTVPPTATYNVVYPGGSAAATGGAGALTYTVFAGALPNGLGLNGATGAITGTPTAGGTFNFTIKAADAFGDSNTQAYTIVVSYPTLAVTPASLPAAYVGSNYPQTTLTATGGTGLAANYVFALAGGTNVPAGMNLLPTGAITGQPTGSPAVTNFSVTVTDTVASLTSAAQPFSITVNAGVSITTATPLPGGYGGTAYSVPLAATGGTGTPYTWSITSGGASLTAVGLSLSTGGVVSGTTPIAGTATFTAKATDSASNFATATFTVTIGAGLTITTATTLPSGYGGTPYSQQLAATGGAGAPYTWSVTAGGGNLTTLGLTLSGGGLLSSGGPNQGTGSFTVMVTDSASNQATATFSVTILQALTINSAVSFTGYVGTPYSQTLTTAGGTGTGLQWSYNFGGANLAAIGLSLGSNGVITGATPILGSASFGVKVVDSANNQAYQSITITVVAGITITTATTLPGGYGGTAYSAPLAATGGAGAPYTWTVTTGGPSLAAVGLSLSTGGVLSGTTPISGVASFTAKATDSASNIATATFSVTINAGVTITTTSPLPTGYVGTAYSQSLLATGGAGAPYTWSITSGGPSLAAVGLSLSAGGVLSGATPIQGTATFTAKVTDSASNVATQTFSVTINAALAITSPATLPAGYVGSPYSQGLTATGGSGMGLNWTVTSGGASLAGIGLSVSTAGVVSGPSPTLGTASFTVKVTDSASNSTTANLSVTVGNGLTITTGNPLPSGYAGAAYTQTLTSAGGTGTGLSWSVTSGASNLTAVGLSLSSGGVLSGTNPVAGTASFTVKLTDSGPNSTTANFTVTINAGVTITTSSPLPVGYVGMAYSQPLAATGGAGAPYTWSVTSGGSTLTAVGLSVSTGGVISGATPIAGTANFTVQATDSASNKATQTYSLTVNGALAITSPATLPGGNAGVAYTQTLTTTGGSGTGLNWTVTSGGSDLTTIGLSLSTGGVLSGGTPVAGTANFNVQVTDSALNQANASLSVTITAGNQVGGQIMLSNVCNYSGAVPQIKVTINTSPSQFVNTDSNGKFNFASIPNGTYTLTPSISGPSAVFYPATLTGVVVDSADMLNENFGAALGYTVSGTATYSGSTTGQVYLNLVNNCGGGGEGTSLTAPGSFTIHGVPPGSFTLQSWMDPSTLNEGAQNVTDPKGSVAVAVSNADVTGADVGLTDPTLSAPTQTPNLKSVSPTNLGVVISFGGGSISNNQGVEVFTSYEVEASLSSSFTSPITATFKGIGTKANIWIMNNGTAGLTGGTFSDLSKYYFRVMGKSSAGNSAWVYWGGSGVSCSVSTCAIQVTVGEPSTGDKVTGTVVIPSSITLGSGAHLYVGLYDQNLNIAYGYYIASPVTGATGNGFTIYVPAGTNYFEFGILDQNKDGLIDAGDVTNTNDNGSGGMVSVAGTTPLGTITLPATNSTAQVQTQFNQNLFWNGTTSQTNINYNLNFQVREGNLLPVSVQLTSASNPNVITPVDLSNYCQGCGSVQFQYYSSINSDVPAVNDTYNFTVYYSNNTHATVVGTVNAVLGTSALATNMEPQATDSTSTTPTFTWDYPTSPTSYTYQFYVCCGNNGNIWQIPGNNSNTNGFTNTQIPAPVSLVWGTDPTDGSNTPTSTLNSTGTTYNWSIQSQDSNGNSAENTVWYEPLP